MHVVFFDLETGGLDWRVHPIIQIAAIAVDGDLNAVEHFERKLKFAENVCDKQALEGNHYDPAVWAKEAVEPKRCVTDFSVFLSKHADIVRISQKSQNPYNVAQMAGHNAASFDFAFLKELYRQHNAFLPASYRVLDTLQRSAWFFQERLGESGSVPESLKLGELATYFGVKLENAHDALADVKATIAVYRKMIGVD